MSRSSRWHRRCFTIICSKRLQQTQVSQTGLYFEVVCLSPFLNLKIGLRVSGSQLPCKKTVSRDLEKIFANRGAFFAISFFPGNG